MMRKLLLLALLSTICITQSLAASSPTIFTEDPMVIGGGARPLGMGRAFTAICDDADAPLINPAGIAGLKAPQVMSMFTNLLSNIYYTEYTGALPTKYGVFGAAFVNTGASGVTIIGDPLKADYHDTLFLLSYSSPAARFSNFGRNLFFGLNLKYFSRGWVGGSVDHGSATAWSADIGMKYIYNPYLSFGFNRQNFLPVDLGGVLKWTSGAEEAISGIYKVGVAIKPVPFRKKLLVAYDVDLPAYSGRPVTSHAGAEYQLTDSMMIRGGFDQSVDAGSATGTSWNPALGVSLGSSGLRLDYAYHAYYNDPSLATHYISFSYRAEPNISLEGEIL